MALDPLRSSSHTAKQVPFAHARRGRVCSLWPEPVSSTRSDAPKVPPPFVLSEKKTSLLPSRLSCQAAKSRPPAAARPGCHWLEGVSRFGSKPARESSSWRGVEKV